MKIKLFLCLGIFIFTTNSCQTNEDCSYLGICNTNTKECKCNDNFYGTHCNYMNYTQINWNIDGYNNPTTNTNTSTWDGWAIKSDNKYHLFISIITNNCPLQGYWTTNSIIAHVISNNAIGPYIFNDIALYPNTNKSAFDSLSVFNPAVIQVNDTFLLYYTATASKNQTSSNCTKYNTQMLSGAGSTQRIGLASAKSLYGPWTRSPANPIIKPNATKKTLWNSQFVTNPAPLLLKNNSIAVIYKAKPIDQNGNSKSTMYHGIAMSEDINGPYVTINKEKALNVPTFCADPFLWSSYNDSIFHILFQCHWNCSQQIAYSNDLLNWNYFNEQKWCDVMLTNNSNVNLLRRERPCLLFDNNHNIEYLYTAVQMENAQTFNLVQQM
eukprot:224246_1